MAKKPAGTLGVNRVDMGPDGIASHTFERFPFPPEKEAIEVMMARDFIESMHRQMASFGVPWIMSDPRQNPQDDFDFTISLPNNRTASLELMEIAPLELFGGYNGVPPDYKPYDLAQVINAMIMKKAVKYSGQLGQELHLLTYITHWGFTPSDSLILLLRHFLSQEQHPFSAIYLYAPLQPGVGTGYALAPVAAAMMAGFDPERFKDNRVINLNPATFQLIQPPREAEDE